jgi:hypothetical protein
MSNLYQDAILDAKALRASAMANAKAALEEAFEPKIQEMLRLKLSEELDEVEEIEEVEVEEAVHPEMQDENVGGVDENLDINEAELEEILSQLEELSNVGEADHMKDEAYGHKEEAINEAEEEGEEDEEEDEVEGDDDVMAGEEEVVDDETKVIDITLGDLKQVLQSVMAGGQQDLGLAGDEAGADSEAEAEISLDEILAELEAENESVQDVMSSPGSSPEGNIPEMEEAKKHDKKKDAVEDELEEAKATIETLRQGLQEVNLLNAKYLYMNKLFKSKTLTESQKVKVINALDRAASVAEVKNTYETLKESFEAKKQLKESIGFASQSAGVAPKQSIIEQDNMMSRWQKLAGIK